MKINQRISFTLFGLMLLLITPPAIAEEFPRPKVDFSADMIIDAGKGPDGRSRVLTGKLYSTQKSERREVQQSGHNAILITNRDDGPLWILMPENKTYMEIPGGNEKKEPEQLIREGDLTLTKLGSEMVNGVEATKYKMTTQNEGAQFDGHLWVTEDNIPVRMEGDTKGNGPPGHFKMDYKNIMVGKQDPALFKIPPDYKKMVVPAMPGMGDMPGGHTSKGMPPEGMTEDQATETAEQMKKQMEEMMKELPKQQGSP